MLEAPGRSTADLRAPALRGGYRARAVATIVVESSIIMRNLEIAVRAFCVVPFLTGGFDLLGGARFPKSAGVPLDDELSANAVLDSQVRFCGAIWVGYGIILWRAAAQLRSDPDGFRVLCGILALSGLGRLASIMRCGSPGVPLTSAMAVELMGAAGACY